MVRSGLEDDQTSSLNYVTRLCCFSQLQLYCHVTEFVNHPFSTGNNFQYSLYCLLRRPFVEARAAHHGISMYEEIGE